MMVETEHPGESRDNDRKGVGDHDLAFAFGHPRSCLTVRVQARLTIMRGYVLDHEGAVVGDDDRVVLSKSGLWLPE